MTKPEVVNPAQLQTDRSKCWKCSKKTKITAMACKCEFVFCQRHSLPEYHECGFDFEGEGKKRLEQKNPGFVKAQLDSI